MKKVLVNGKIMFKYGVYLLFYNMSLAPYNCKIRRHFSSSILRIAPREPIYKNSSRPNCASGWLTLLWCGLKTRHVSAWQCLTCREWQPFFHSTQPPQSAHVWGLAARHVYAVLLMQKWKKHKEKLLWSDWTGHVGHEAIETGSYPVRSKQIRKKYSI